MRILNLENSKKPRGIEIKALMSDTEFGQLLSNLDHLCVFATNTVDKPAKAIKTGARHSAAKWLLVPIALRRQYKTSEFDFDDVTCSAVRYRDKLYVIYGVPKKALVAPLEDESNH